MQIESLKTKASALRAMHTAAGVLILPNVWDAVTARIIETAGFPALATTSAGVAFALGYPDGQRISRDEMLAGVARIARAVKIPVSADVEAAYGDRPEDAAITARGVLEAGAVGINLEDGTDDPDHPLLDVSLQLEKIAAVQEAGKKAGVRLVLNARTDAYLLQVGEESARYDLAVGRCMAFRNAGADCVFVPGLGDEELIRRFVVDLGCPVNILAGPGSLTIPELESLGVKRVSLGSSPMRATLGLLRKVAEELKSAGTYKNLEDAPPHGEVNRMMAE